MNRSQALSSSPEYFRGYIQEIPDREIISILQQQLTGFHAFFLGLEDADWERRYAEGKWSVKEVVGHMIDTERIFGYRAMRIARKDATDLAGFDENAYVVSGEFDRRTPMSLMEEFDLVRRSNLVMLQGLPEGAMERLGTANSFLVSVGALAWIMAGHVEHHTKVIAERYMGR